MLGLLTALSLGFAALRLPPADSVVARRVAPTMQLPDLGKAAQKAAAAAGGKFMEGMGLGGDLGLSDEEKEAMEARLKEGEMSFDDFLKQVQMMQKAGSMQAMLKKGPFGSGQEAEAQLKEGEKKLKRYAAYTECLEPDEFADPALVIDEAKAVRAGAQPVRLKRLAEASDSTVEEVGLFITEFAALRKAAAAFARGEDPNTIKQMMMDEQEGARPPLNRAMRRMKAKKTKKAPKTGGGFGR